MAERLTFNYGAAPFGREVRGRATSREKAALPDAAAPFLPPIERPDWAYWGVFAFTALLFFRPQDTVPLLAPLHLPEVAAIAALLAMLGHRLARRLPLVRGTPELAGIGAMALVMLLTAPFSIWPGGAISTFLDVYIKVVLIFILMVNSIKGFKVLQQFTWLIVVAMGYVAARGVLDYARGINLVRGERLHGSISGLMGNPNDLAMNMVTFLPFAVVMAMARGRPLPRLASGTIALLMLATVLFTKSRAGLLGLVVMGIVLVVQMCKIRPGITAMMIVGLLAASPFMPASLWARVSSIVNPAEDDTGSREARKDLLRQGWQTFLEHPLTGVGAGQFKNYNPPGRLEPWRETHNVVLQIATELGIFGVLVFLYLLTRMVAALFWTKRIFSRAAARAPAGTIARPDAFRPEEREAMRLYLSAMAASFAGWLVCAQFASIGYYWTFYYLFALILAARQITAERLDAARRALGRPAPAWMEKRTA